MYYRRGKENATTLLFKNMRLQIKVNICCRLCNRNIYEFNLDFAWVLCVCVVMAIMHMAFWYGTWLPIVLVTFWHGLIICSGFRLFWPRRWLFFGQLPLPILNSRTFGLIKALFSRTKKKTVPHLKFCCIRKKLKHQSNKKKK